MTIEKTLKNLSNTSGIYRFYNAVGQLLYIGKAANLRRRVRSYWQKKNGLYPREFVEQIAKIETIKTDSVIEALILEANEINARQPPYNLRQKDDKTFITIGMTNELFPAVIITRPTQKLKVPLKYQFGPYPSADQARLALRIIRKIFPFRSTCKIILPNRLDQSHSTSRKRLRKKRVEKGRGCLDYQLGLCPGPCASAITQQDYAKIITKIRLFLLGRKQQLLKTIKHEMIKAAKKHEFEVAARLRNQLFAIQHIQDVALLKQELGMTNKEGEAIPRRIEAYDISNIGADYAVGSMVVLTNGKPDKPEYRKFQIKTIARQNDLKMMEEVLVRRFRHLEWRLPDLLVIDGGAEHLKVAQKVLKAAQRTIPIIAVAKGPKRDRLDLYPSDPKLLPAPSPASSAGGYQLEAVLRRARDEAHRFAIRYHRTRRTKGFLLT